MPKPMLLENLLQDLVYIIKGTYVHQWLFDLCPSQPGLRVLEPGCGSGKFGLSYALRQIEPHAGVLARIPATVSLFDIDPTVVAYAQRLKAALDVLTGDLLGAEIHREDIFMAPLSALLSNAYDLVLNEGVPQHWAWTDERRQGCIDRMARWARPGGLVVIIGNNGLNPSEQAIDRTASFTYEGMPPQRKCFTPDELRERMERAGLTDIHVDPLGGGWRDAVLIGAWGRK